jgi:phosphoribosylformylglycinamidine synthase
LRQICGQGWQNAGDRIYLLGLPLDADVVGAIHKQSLQHSAVTLGGSEYLAAIHGVVAGKPPIVDFALERRVQAVCREGIRQGWVRSAHDCAEGGVAIALAEACISGQRGADIRLEFSSKQVTERSLRWDHLLFGEGGARILVSVSSAQAEIWESYLQDQLGDNWQRLGQVQTTNSPLQVLTVDNLPLISARIEEMGDRWHNAIHRRLNI